MVQFALQHIWTQSARRIRRVAHSPARTPHRLLYPCHLAPLDGYRKSEGCRCSSRAHLPHGWRRRYPNAAAVKFGFGAHARIPQNSARKIWPRQRSRSVARHFNYPARSARLFAPRQSRTSHSRVRQVGDLQAPRTNDRRIPDRGGEVAQCQVGNCRRQPSSGCRVC